MNGWQRFFSLHRLFFSGCTRKWRAPRSQGKPGQCHYNLSTISLILLNQQIISPLQLHKTFSYLNSKIWFSLPHLYFTHPAVCFAFVITLSSSISVSQGPQGEPGPPGQQGTPGTQVRQRTAGHYHTLSMSQCVLKSKCVLDDLQISICWEIVFIYSFILFLQGMAGPQGPLGPPGEKVRSQKIEKQYSFWIWKYAHLLFLLIFKGEDW